MIDYLCAVTIFYNPTEKEIVNLKTYNSFFKTVYVIDNSNTDNSKLLLNLSNIKYIPNNQNLGIAKAQNIGCMTAYKDGFTWCMMMDQDSYWNENQLNKYFNQFLKYKENNYFSFGVNTESNQLITSYYQDFKNFIKKIIHYQSKIIQKAYADIEEIDILIASGNIFSLEKWKEVGGFLDLLFIDEVDHAFSLILKEKYGNCLLKFNTIYLNHHLGNPVKTLFSRYDFHHGVRLYYCVRNMLYLTDIFPSYNTKWLRRKSYSRVFFQNIRDFYFKDVLFMIKGYFAYKNHLIGEYTEEKKIDNFGEYLYDFNRIGDL